MKILAVALAIGRKEFRQIGRDRRTLMILLFVPAFFLLLYGYALSFDVRNIALAVQDNDRSRVSRDIISALVNSGYFDLVGEVSSGREIVDVINRNQARAVLVIPGNMGGDVTSGEPATVQLVVNGDNANTATTVIGYARSIVGLMSAQLSVEPLRGAVNGPLVSIESRVWYNPELRSALFLVPGLIAYISMLTAVVSAALSIVREKEAGTIEQIRMAPIHSVAYVSGKIIPYFAVSLASSLGIVWMAMLLFDLPMRGSWLVLLGTISLFLVGALAWGLLISTLAETQQVAFQMALLTSYLPTFMLSGFVFPISSMPAFLQTVTYIVPARYFLVALRGIVLKGTGPSAYWEQLVALVIFALVVLGLASLRLRRQWA